MEIEIRKHFSHLTSEEKTFLNSFLTKDKKEYRIDEHASKRSKEKIITNESIYKAINNGKIIEYHYKQGNRVLVRGNEDENGYNTCVVLNCDTMAIITTFYNSSKDNHFNLDRSLYRKNFDVLSMFKKKKIRGNNGCFGNTYNNININCE